MIFVCILSILIVSGPLFADNSSLVTECPDLTARIHPIGIAPSPQQGYGPGNDQLAQPDDVEILQDGSLLVSDVNNNRLQLFSGDGKYLRTIGADELRLDGEFAPTGISKDAEGFVYISCEGAGVIVRLNPDLSYDRTIGRHCEIKDTEYYCPGNAECLITPQGIIVSAGGDVFIIDMDDSFRRGHGGKIRNFGFRRFSRISERGVTRYAYDDDYADTQEITKVMRKSEGMAISESHGILFVAEEKPLAAEFGNINKYRYIAAFDLETGKYLNRLYGVDLEDGKIVSGLFKDSVEGVAVYGDYLFAVDEKAGRVYIFDIETGKPKGYFGTRAPYYCNYKSDCVIEGTNYNEQSIIAGSALPHLKNKWESNELASPDGINVIELSNGEKRLAVVDQWNMRIVYYDLDEILGLIGK